MGPGDIATHAYNGHPENMLDKNDRVRREVRAAAERGVVMDVGHAGVHCDVEISKAAIAEGFYPTSISTDIHNPPPERVVYGMSDLVSKFHAMGQPTGRRPRRQHVASSKSPGHGQGNRDLWPREQ